VKTPPAIVPGGAFSAGRCSVGSTEQLAARRAAHAGLGLELVDFLGGCQAEQFTAAAVKIDATASVTRELLDDYSDFISFVRAELTQAVVDRETSYVIDDPSAGILATSAILTRNANLSVNDRRGS
jgi:hypothetical protein